MGWEGLGRDSALLYKKLFCVYYFSIPPALTLAQQPLFFLSSFFFMLLALAIKLHHDNDTIFLPARDAGSNNQDISVRGSLHLSVREPVRLKSIKLKFTGLMKLARNDRKFSIKTTLSSIFCTDP